MQAEMSKLQEQALSLSEFNPLRHSKVATAATMMITGAANM